MAVEGKATANITAQSFIAKSVAELHSVGTAKKNVGAKKDVEDLGSASTASINITARIVITAHVKLKHVSSRGTSLRVLNVFRSICRDVMQTILKL